MGLDAGLDIEAVLGRLETPGLGATPSSGSGPRVEPPLADEVPDMADTESPLLLLERIRDCWS